MNSIVPAPGLVPTAHTLSFPSYSLFTRSSSIPRLQPSCSPIASSHSASRIPSIAAPPIPPATVIERGIRIGGENGGTGDGHEGDPLQWTVTTVKSGTILNSVELDALTSTLPLPHVPDMVFNSHVITLTHHPSHVVLTFNAADALRHVNPDRTEEGVEVEAAGIWGRGRGRGEFAVHGLQVIKPYDWTFTPWVYKGNVVVQDSQGNGDMDRAKSGVDGARADHGAARSMLEIGGGDAVDVKARGGEDGNFTASRSSSPSPIPPHPPTGHQNPPRPPPLTIRTKTPTMESSYFKVISASTPIPAIDYALLRRRDPILFFDEVPLYEDELADNGSTALLVKVRVMPHSFLLLLRHVLRIDHVLVRISDTRIFTTFAPPSSSNSHSYSTLAPPGMIVREHRVSQAPYDLVRARLTIAKSRMNMKQGVGPGHSSSGAVPVRHAPTASYTPHPLRGAVSTSVPTVSIARAGGFVSGRRGPDGAMPPPSSASNTISGHLAAVTTTSGETDPDPDLSAMTDRDLVVQCVDELMDEAFGSGCAGRKEMKVASLDKNGSKEDVNTKTAESFWRTVETEVGGV
ncbi:hypothetical protein HDU93_009221 [Gonapodya sp. JEL0774]|nr:hypothetical protein HDU93_009221 [Gonapodya sp. JEL0774]